MGWRYGLLRGSFCGIRQSFLLRQGREITHLLVDVPVAFGSRLALTRIIELSISTSPFARAVEDRERVRTEVEYAIARMVEVAVVGRPAASTVVMASVWVSRLVRTVVDSSLWRKNRLESLRRAEERSAHTSSLKGYLQRNRLLKSSSSSLAGRLQRKRRL